MITRHFRIILTCLITISLVLVSCSTTTTTQNKQPIEVVSVTGPLQPFTPGGPTVEITLKNVSTEPIISLTAFFVEFTEPGPHDFDFAVTSANPLLSGKSISDTLTLINGGFGNNTPYHLTITGTLQNGAAFTYTKQVEIVAPTTQ